MSTQEAQQGGTMESGGASAPDEASASSEQGPSAMGQSGGTGGSPASGQPSEEELRAAYEAELSRITSADMVLQATVSLLNIGARRLGMVGGADATAASPERDLEQVRDAIDAVRGLMAVVERRAPQEARPLRDALAQLQMAYARESQAATPPQAQTDTQGAPAAAPPASGTGGADRAGGSDTAQPATGTPGGKTGPGPAESSGRLWVPGR